MFMHGETLLSLRHSWLGVEIETELHDIEVYLRQFTSVVKWKDERGRSVCSDMPLCASGTARRPRKLGRFGDTSAHFAPGFGLLCLCRHLKCSDGTNGNHLSTSRMSNVHWRKDESEAHMLLVQGMG